MTPRMLHRVLVTKRHREAMTREEDVPYSALASVSASRSMIESRQSDPMNAENAAIVKRVVTTLETTATYLIDRKAVHDQVEEAEYPGQRQERDGRLARRIALVA
eukprot:CAMPEP_0173324798 /NCGR_PEP_ID=MMETSP1144-20121109/134_1 /TAXON_ID=483371 /ORGANISM="non described non described, Strain CCMP2298" /LENGTH=104 /DNA_ID=CAMNT_0014268885 /DNA_START=170 /DNA_END=484 /DNA_ORIENTATION=-